MTPRDLDPNPTRPGLEDADLDVLLRRLPGADATEPDLGDDTAHVDDRELLALSAGRLSDVEAAQVEVHLGRCAACRALLVELAAPVSPSLSAAAEQTALDAARVAPRPAGRLGRWAVVTGMLAAAGLALAIGVGRTPDGVSHPDFDWTREYTSEAVVGGTRGDRSPTTVESLRVQPRSNVSWTLRAEGADKAPAVGVYVGRPGGRLQSVREASVVRAPGGTIRVQATGRALGGSDFGLLIWVVALTAAPVDLSDRPAEAPGSAIEPGVGVVFTKTLTYEPEDAP